MVVMWRNSDSYLSLDLGKRKIDSPGHFLRELLQLKALQKSPPAARRAMLLSIVSHGNV